MHLTGQCHCGNVKFEADANPDQLVICHCTDCQRLTGSPFRVTLRVKRSDLHLSGAEPKIYRKHVDNGNIRRQYFCGDCGTPLLSGADNDEAEELGIRWGAINERTALKPHVQIWTRSRVDWLGDIETLSGYPKEHTK